MVILIIILSACNKNRESVKSDSEVPPYGVLKEIKILDYPETEIGSLTPWDVESPPDIYVNIIGENTLNTIIYTNEGSPIADISRDSLPASIYFDLPGELRIPDLDRFYMVKFWDNDTGNDLPDDYMGVVSFRLIDFTYGDDPYPNQFKVLQSDFFVEFTIEWHN